MTRYPTEPWAQLHHGDVRAVAALLPPASVQSIVTSPPYWMLRTYHADGQLGREATPAEYVANLVAVFDSLRPALRPDGTLWLNLGDSFAATGRGGGGSFVRENRAWEEIAAANRGAKSTPPGYKRKDLLGLPWRVAFALQDAGWYLRSEVIWYKPNPMPESARDRPGRTHEHLFLFTQKPRYFYDRHGFVSPPAAAGQTRHTEESFARTVWKIAPQGLKLKHYAAFPVALAERCLRLATSAAGCCPACGRCYRRLTQAVRVPTRPGQRTKIPFPANWASTTATRHRPEDLDAIRELAGNRDPRRHVTRYQTLGFEPACRCDAGQPVPCRVLDPFHGTGSTGVACDRLGLRYTGIELADHYLPFFADRLAHDRARRLKSARKTRRPKPQPSQRLLFDREGEQP